MYTDNHYLMQIPKRGEKSKSLKKSQKNGTFKDHTVPDVRCFDFTSRILSSLVEEKSSSMFVSNNFLHLVDAVGLVRCQK